MSDPLIVTLPGNEVFGALLADALGASASALSVHRFPDDETLVRFPQDVTGRDVVLLCTLDRPDAKVLPLLFAAATARDLGAASVGLVAPYLCYMRQDTRFRPGEAVSAKVFAATLSNAFDWLVTVDPHLHRMASLSDVFSIPADTIHADAEIADWISHEVHHPLLVGPDSESTQWITLVAKRIGCPTLVLEKTRQGDAEVSISVPDTKMLASATPVIVDDIISTAQTMRKTVLMLKKLGAVSPVCVGVHALFAGDAYRNLAATGARIVTANTIRHETNRIDLVPAIAEAIGRRLNSMHSEENQGSTACGQDCCEDQHRRKP